MEQIRNILEELERTYSKNMPQEGYLLRHKKRYIKIYIKISNLLKKEDSILDIGCSPCFFMAFLKKIGYNIEGIDANPEKDKIVKGEKLKINKVNIEKEALPFEENTFDKILFLDVFEHLYTNPLFVMDEIKRVLKPNGYLIFTTPNGYSLKRIFKFIGGIGWGEDIYKQFLKLKIIGYPGHIREYSAYELKKFLKKNNLEIEHCLFFDAGHKTGQKKNRIIKKILSIMGEILYPFRTHILIIARNK